MVAGLLDWTGRPFAGAEPEEPVRRTNGHHANGVREKSTGGQIIQLGGSYESGLSLTRMASFARARDPFLSSTWVFAAAVRAALASSQAEYRVFRETDEELRLRAKRLGPELGVPRAGVHRRAVQRWINRSATARAMHSKALEPLFSHRVMDLLMRPNPYQHGNELMILAVLWLAVRGEATWILTDADGMPRVAGEEPERVWPVPPDSLKPIHERPQGGEIVAWELAQPKWMAGYRSGARLVLPLVAVVQFKLPNPADISRGLSPLSAAAGTIEFDILQRASVRKLIENGGMPPNILYSEEPMGPKEVQDIRDDFEKLGKEKRTAILSGGLKVAALGFTPQQMGTSEPPKYLRQEVLASMGSSESALGLSQASTYASALIEDYSFWEKGILPNLKLIETGMDAAFFSGETDRVFGMFDLSGVEALRAGVMEKLEAARDMCGQELHAPPSVAYQVVGLDVPEYEGDDVAFAGIGVVPVADVLEPPAPAPAPATPPAEETPPVDPNAEDETPAAAAARAHARTAKARSSRRNAEFVELQAVPEREMSKVYRGWVGAERALVLDAFDELAGKLKARRTTKETDLVDLRVVLPSTEQSAKRFAMAARPLQVDTLLKVVEFTEQEIGPSVFAIDDEAFLRFFRMHEGHFAGETAEAVRRNLAKAIEEGLRASDTLLELRSRVGQVFDIAASSPKTLLVARTTTASFMNGVRDQMFHLQGIEKIGWSTSGDEHVRSSHVLFGEAGPQAIGFNFLSLTGAAGRLEYPGDVRAPFGERANCRCNAVPLE